MRNGLRLLAAGAHIIAGIAFFAADADVEPLAVGVVVVPFNVIQRGAEPKLVSSQAAHGREHGVAVDHDVVLVRDHRYLSIQKRLHGVEHIKLRALPYLQLGANALQSRLGGFDLDGVSFELRLGGLQQRPSRGGIGGGLLARLLDVLKQPLPCLFRLPDLRADAARFVDRDGQFAGIAGDLGFLDRARNRVGFRCRGIWCQRRSRKPFPPLRKRARL